MKALLRNILIGSVLVTVGGRSHPSSHAQDGAAIPQPPPASAQVPPPPASSDVPLNPQLEDFRQSIVEPSAEYGTRVTVGTLLVRVGTEEALRVATSLLDIVEPAEVPRAVCEAIARAGSENPALVAVPGSAELVDRLAVLIGAEDPELRGKAAAALAVMPRALMITRLIKAASDTQAPESRRLAALEALSRHIHHRQVAGVMISLLDDPSAAVSGRALAALPPVVRSPAPTTRQAWKDWWKSKEEMTAEEWLQERVDFLSHRVGSLESQRSELQAALDRQGSALAARIADLQSDVYFALPEKARDEKLITWLSETTPAVCGGAMQLVLRRIGESGGAPPDAIRTGVRRHLDHPSAEVRRRVLQIVGAIKDPQDAGLVIDRLDREANAAVRQAALGVLGQLKNPAAVPVLVAEISNAAAPVESVLAGARALADVASGELALDAERLAACVQALKARSAALGGNGNGAAYAAIIEAMAAIAAPDFEAEFLAAVDRTDPAVLKPALRGLMKVKSRGKLSQVRALTAAADAQVRQTACEVLGALGTEDADLEALLPRLRADVEAQAVVRDAAWAAIRTMLDARSGAEQLRWIDRLADVPAQQSAYLASLLAPPRAAQAEPEFLSAVRERLGAALMAQGRWSEAIDPLQALFDSLSAEDAARSVDVGLRVVECRLKSQRIDGLAAFLEPLIRRTPDAATRAAAVILAYLDLPEGVSPASADALEAQLRSISAAGLPEAWERMIKRFDTPQNPPGDASP